MRQFIDARAPTNQVLPASLWHRWCRKEGDNGIKGRRKTYTSIHILSFSDRHFDNHRGSSCDFKSLTARDSKKWRMFNDLLEMQWCLLMFEEKRRSNRHTSGESKPSGVISK